MQNLTKISRSNTTLITPVWYGKMQQTKRIFYTMLDMAEFPSAEEKVEEG